MGLNEEALKKAIVKAEAKKFCYGYSDECIKAAIQAYLEVAVEPEVNELEAKNTEYLSMLASMEASLDEFTQDGFRADSAIKSRDIARNQRNKAFKLARGYKGKIKELEAELERERVRLAGCGVAALGYDKPPIEKDSYGYSASYQDVVNLRNKLEELKQAVRELENTYYYNDDVFSCNRCIACDAKVSQEHKKNCNWQKLQDMVKE